MPQSVRRSGKPLFFGWGAHLTHHEREQVKERIAAGIGIVLALAVIGILLNGWYQDNVAKPQAEAARRNAPAVQIGNTVINRGYYDSVLKYRKSLLKSQLSSYQTELTTLEQSKSKKSQTEAQSLSQYLTQLESQQASAPTDTLTQLINDNVIKQRGPAAGLHISKAGEAKFLHKIIYKSAGSPGQFATTAQHYGMTPAQFKNMFLMDYRQQQMQKVLAAKVKKTQLEVHVRHILVKNKKAAGHRLAIRIQHELQAGGSWKKLAAKYGTDATKTKGGDLGWAAPKSYVPGFRKAALKDKVGAVVVVHSQFGWHVMEVLARGPKRVSASTLSSDKQQALQTWLAKEEKRKGYVKKFIHPTVAPVAPNGLSGSGIPGATGGLPPSSGSNGTTGSGSTSGSGTAGNGSTGTGSNGTGTGGSGSGSSSSNGKSSGTK